MAESAILRPAPQSRTIAVVPVVEQEDIEATLSGFFHVNARLESIRVERRLAERIAYHRAKIREERAQREREAS